MQYRNGERYEGTWKDDTAHGKGTLTYAGGDRYVGEWCEGKKHGTGELHYVNGDVFRGEWKGDFATGLGVLHYASGDVYNGQVGRQGGRGTAGVGEERGEGGLSRGVVVVVVQWLNDRRHGHGKFTCAEDGKTYEGQWRDGMRHGLGE